MIDMGLAEDLRMNRTWLISRKQDINAGVEILEGKYGFFYGIGYFCFTEQQRINRISNLKKEIKV